MNRGIRLAQTGLVVNGVLAAVKLVAGVLGNSYALIADAVESMSDIFSGLIVWGGLRFASRDPDERYPFGYGKAETVSAAVVGLMLAAAALGIGVEAVREIQTPHHSPARFTLVVLVVVVLVKESLFRFVLRGAAETGSLAVTADAWHHRSDAITSAFAFVGISLALLGGPGWEPADDWAALAASFVILFNGINIIRPALADLMDRSPNEEVFGAVDAAARSVEGVLATEKLKIRKSGSKYLLELHVQAGPGLTLHAAHILSGKVKRAIRTQVPAVRDVLVHMEPFEHRAPGPPAQAPDTPDAQPIPRLPARFDRRLAALGIPNGPVIVAVSGGPDSLALLDLLRCAPAAAGLILHVAHADHGIHPDSATVAESVKAMALEHHLAVHLTRLELGIGATETTARAARYHWLFRLADEVGATAVLTAHHRDDQVETILMRLLKGSGPAGLAGIATRRGILVRPLLPFRREELAEHVQRSGLTPWNDPANLDPRNLRSWIRNDLLPRLRQQLPDVDGRILSAGRQAATDRRAWDEVLELIPGLDLLHEASGVSVAVPPLQGYDSVVVRALMGALGRRVGGVIGPDRAGRVERLVRSGASGAMVELGSGIAAELSFGRLRLFRGLMHPPSWEPQPLAGDEGQIQVGEWCIEWRRDRAPGLLERTACSSWFTEGQYQVRPWQAGDRLRPVGGNGRRLVVRCMQDQRIARSRRAGWPVIESGGSVVWVPGVSRSAEQVPLPGAMALRIDARLS